MRNLHWGEGVGGCKASSQASVGLGFFLIFDNFSNLEYIRYCIL